MSAKDLETLVKLNGKLVDMVNTSAEKFNLSGRAHHRLLKVARTIADLDGADEVGEQHILEALQYRPKRGTAGITH